MKFFFSIVAWLLLMASVFAQAPQKMSYQAVIRNSSNVLITSTTVGMQISILKGSSNGTPVYVETQKPSTNANALVSLEIGTGTVISGTFATINWATGPYFIKTETDPTGGTAYTIAGINELMSVPYALFSANGTPGATGPQGANGATGVTGSIGLTGAAGAIGLTGAIGPTGATGPAGAQGIAGTNGTNGAVGVTGTIGLTGLGGPAGPQGIQGLTGTNGATGVTGSIGLTGAAGATGPQGTAGNDGAAGATGTTGATGPAGAQGIQGLTGATGPTGAIGAAGTNGKTVANGTTDPATSTGVDGDFYINTATNTLFGPKASGTWPTGESLVGPQGATGATGSGFTTITDVSTGDTGNSILAKQTSNSAYAIQNVVVTGAGSVGIGTITPAAGFRLDVVDTNGTGIRISDNSNTSSLRTQWSDALGTVTAVKNGALPTSINFNTQNSTGATTSTLLLNSGTVGIRGANNSAYPLTVTRFNGASGNIQVIGSNGLNGSPKIIFNDEVSPNFGVISYDGATFGIDAPLDLSTASSNTPNTIAQFRNTDFTAGNQSYLRVRQQANAVSSYSSYFGTGQDGKLYIIANDPARGGDLVIDPNTGYVGIGTTGPNDLLQLSSTNATAYDPQSDTGQYGTGSGITIGNLDTTTESFSQVNMQVSSASGRALGRIVTIKTAGGTSDMAFVTENANVTAEKMRITAGGDVLIGSTADQGNWKTQVTGNMFIRGSDTSGATDALYMDNSSGIGLFRVKNDGLIGYPKINDFTTGSAPNAFIATAGSNGIYISTSSRRYKKDILNYDKGLDIVNQLRPVYYKGISEVDGDKQFAGFIAEEIHDLGLTEFVNYLEDGRPNSLSYPNMITLLTKAIQEQQQQIQELKTEINSLKSRIDTLKQ
jgi:hypothetical protein